MYNIGVDVGGTNIAAGLVDEKFNIKSKISVKTELPITKEGLCDKIINLINKILSTEKISLKDINNIGIGVPGTVNTQTGVAEYLANLGLENWDIKAMLSNRMHKKIRIENDANAAAYGEYIAGAARGYDISITVTLGTGVGCGIIVNGKVYKGCNYNAAEVGHMVIAVGGKRCNCGRNGCWEAYASIRGLVDITKTILVNEDKSKQSIIWQLINDDTKNIGGRTAFKAMDLGDELGKKIVNTYTDYVGCGITNLINIFQPSVICIGGGISREGDKLIDPIKQYVKRERYSRHSNIQTNICRASLCNDAGIIGAAFLDRL